MRRNLLLPLGAAALVLLFWKLRMTDPAVGYELGSLDFYTQLYPMWFRAGAWMRAGILPLWNPYQMCGHPFLASVLYGIFYPPNLVRLVVPADVAIEVNIVLHLWLALLFMYLYARTIGLAPLAALLAAVAYALSGGAVFEASWFTATIAAMVWLPLGLAAVEKVFRTSGAAARRWTAVLALALAMPILAGWLQVWLYNTYAIGAYTTCRAAVRLLRRRPGGMRAALLVAAALALALGVAAVQLLPSMELQALGPRGAAGGLTVAQSLPMSALAPEVFLRGAVDANPGSPRQTYSGMGALLLLPLALMAPRHRMRAIFFVLMAGASLLVALSVYSPFYDLYRFLPGANWFRGPWRILCLYSFALAALSGIAFDGLLRWSRPRRMWAAVPIAAVASALFLAVDLPSASRIALGVGAALLLGLALSPWRSVGRAAAAGFTLFVAVDLFAASSISWLRPYGHLGVLDAQKEVFDFIAQHQGLERTFVDYYLPPPEMMHKQATLRGIYSVTDYEGLSLNRTAAFYRALVGRFFQPTPWLFNGSLGLDVMRLGKLDVMSVRFMVLRRDDLLKSSLEAEGWRQVFESPTGSPLVYESPRVLPRAYVSYAAYVAPDPDEALRLILRGAFNPWRFAVLEADGGPAPEQLESMVPIAPAEIVEYEPTRVSVEANAEAPGYLILTDTDYPGWKAEVDGRPAVIHRANYLFRAVRLEPGRHRVTFVYDPSSFKLGAALSILSCALLVVLATTRTSLGISALL